MSRIDKHFDSVASFRTWAAAQHLRRTWGNSKRGIQLLHDGSNTHVADAKALLQTFQEKIEVEKSVWSHSIAGAFPDVPAYIAGVPETMYAKEWIRSDTTPLRVFVGVTSSSGIDERDLIKRGVTIAAFALAMIERRPVIITPYVNLGGVYDEGCIISWDISTEPLVLGELMACLVEPDVIRHLGIDLCYVVNPHVSGMWDPDYDDETKMRARLHAKPEDVYLGSIHLYDKLLSDPIAWVKNMLSKYTEEE